MQHGAWKLYGARRSFFSESADGGTPRVALAQKLSCFVKRFSCGIVKRFAKQLVFAESLHFHELRVSAAH